MCATALYPIFVQHFFICPSGVSAEIYLATIHITELVEHLHHCGVIEVCISFYAVDIFVQCELFNKF